MRCLTIRHGHSTRERVIWNGARVSSAPFPAVELEIAQDLEREQIDACSRTRDAVRREHRA